ncbi:hypothetical protein [Rufibacter ruber]|uniref:hypothetical protein n=1 Tax=Rufibacter ruber TaxID=1783499 RepID=UPI000A82A964|nr:hypothetical protein [Rufibacter ruber]
MFEFFFCAANGYQKNLTLLFSRTIVGRMLLKKRYRRTFRSPFSLAKSKCKQAFKLFIQYTIPPLISSFTWGPGKTFPGLLFRDGFNSMLYPHAPTSPQRMPGLLTKALTRTLLVFNPLPTALY